VLYQVVLFSVTLSDLNYPKPNHFLHFVSLFTSSYSRLKLKTSNLVDRLTQASASNRWQTIP